MTASLNAAAKFIASVLALLISRTATLTGTAIDILDYEGQAIFTLSAGAATAGTNPTLDVVIQHSSDNSSFSAVTGGAFTQVTTTASLQTIVLNVSDLKRYVRVVGTLGGTSTPTFPWSATFYGQKKVG